MISFADDAFMAEFIGNGKTPKWEIIPKSKRVLGKKISYRDIVQIQGYFMVLLRLSSFYPVTKDEFIEIFALRRRY